MSIMPYSSQTTSHLADRRVVPKARGFFAFIMSALHASRRRQAHRIMRQYEHLLTDELKQNSGEREWSLRTERHKQD